MITYTTQESASVIGFLPRRVSCSTLWLSWPATNTQMPSTAARIAEPSVEKKMVTAMMASNCT